MPITKELTRSDVTKKLSGFKADERETSILFDHVAGMAYIETTKPDVARRLFDISGHEDITIDHKTDSFRIAVPMEHARAPELILKPKLRISQDG